MTGSDIVADFIGGPASGKRSRWSGDAHMIRLPLAPVPQDVAGFWDADPSRPVPQRIATYRRCGIRDDGRRIYAYDARCSNA